MTTKSNELVAAQPRKFWMRWRVRIGYPVAVLYWLLAKPTHHWIAMGAAVAGFGILIRADCRRTPQQRSRTSHRRPLRPHAQPALPRQRISSRRIRHRRPFLVRWQPDRNLFRGLLLRRDAQRRSRSAHPLRHRLRRIRRQSPALPPGFFRLRLHATRRIQIHPSLQLATSTAATANTKP